jgi:pectinesterase
VVVAADGSGDHRTVQSALNAAPRKGARRFVIRIKPGTYKEKITIPRGSGAITLLGEDAATTILTYDDYADKLGPNRRPLGTGNTASLRVDADDFVAENITVRNSHPWKNREGQQALAVSFTGDRGTFRKCRLLGWQDTLYLGRNRQFFEECVIAGNVDFIFGGATAFFERCELHCVAGGVAITAASTPSEQRHGFVFARCKVTAKGGGWKTHLGRPWRPHASVTFLNTNLCAVVAAGGWNNWDNAANEKTARFAEYQSTGPGANPRGRVSWSKQLSAAEASKYTPEEVLKGDDEWKPCSKP